MIGQWAYELLMSFGMGSRWGGGGRGLFIRVVLLGFDICGLFTGDCRLYTIHGLVQGRHI